MLTYEFKIFCVANATLFFFIFNFFFFKIFIIEDETYVYFFNIFILNNLFIFFEYFCLKNRHILKKYSLKIFKVTGARARYTNNFSYYQIKSDLFLIKSENNLN